MGCACVYSRTHAHREHVTCPLWRVTAMWRMSPPSSVGTQSDPRLSLPARALGCPLLQAPLQSSYFLLFFDLLRFHRGFSCFLLFVCLCILLIWETGRQKPIYLVHSPNFCNSRAGPGPRQEPETSTWTPQVSDKDASAWAITRCLLGYSRKLESGAGTEFESRPSDIGCRCHRWGPAPPDTLPVSFSWKEFYYWHLYSTWL